MCKESAPTYGSNTSGLLNTSTYFRVRVLLPPPPELLRAGGSGGVSMGENSGSGGGEGTSSGAGEVTAVAAGEMNAEPAAPGAVLGNTGGNCDSVSYILVCIGGIDRLAIDGVLFCDRLASKASFTSLGGFIPTYPVPVTEIGGMAAVAAGLAACRRCALFCCMAF